MVLTEEQQQDSELSAIIQQIASDIEDKVILHSRCTHHRLTTAKEVLDVLVHLYEDIRLDVSSGESRFEMYSLIYDNDEGRAKALEMAEDMRIAHCLKETQTTIDQIMEDVEGK